MTNVLCIDGPLAGKEYETQFNTFVVAKSKALDVSRLWLDENPNADDPFPIREYIYHVHKFAFVDGDVKFIVRVATHHPKPNFNSVLRYILSPKARRAGDYE